MAQLEAVLQPEQVIRHAVEERHGTHDGQQNTGDLHPFGALGGILGRLGGLLDGGTGLPGRGGCGLGGSLSPLGVRQLGNHHDQTHRPQAGGEKNCRHDPVAHIRPGVVVLTAGAGAASGAGGRAAGACAGLAGGAFDGRCFPGGAFTAAAFAGSCLSDRKSTRLNSSHPK